MLLYVQRDEYLAFFRITGLISFDPIDFLEDLTEEIADERRKNHDKSLATDYLLLAVIVDDFF